MSTKRSKPVSPMAQLLLHTKLQEESERTSDQPHAALSNDVVLDRIFGFLSTEDLLHVRLVNRRWNLSAITVLRKHETVTNIVLTNPDDGQCSELGETIAGSVGRWNFPFSGLGVESAADVKKNPRIGTTAISLNRAQEDFFRTYGPMFTRLELKGRGWPASKCLADILLKLMPNLETLGLSRATEDDQVACRVCEYGSTVLGNYNSAESEGLKRLRRLDLGPLPCCFDFVQLLLEKVPSIRSIKCNSDCRALKTVVATGKSHLLTKLKFCELASRSALIDLCRNLAKKPPTNLTEFDLTICGTACAKFMRGVGINPAERELNISALAETVYAILDASKHTIKIWTIALSFPFWLTQMPEQLPELRTLKIRDDAYRMNYGYKKHPPLFPFEAADHVFPKLARIELNSTQAKYFSDLRPILWKKPLRTVKTLCLSSTLLTNCMQNLARLFPSVSTLRVEMGRGVPSVRHNLWARVSPFRNIEHLLLVNMKLRDFTQDEFVLVDLREHEDGVISNLATLKTLTIAFKADSDHVEGRSDLVDILAEASKSVEVRLAYNRHSEVSNRVLKDLLPFATAYHMGEKETKPLCSFYSVLLKLAHPSDYSR